MSVSADLELTTFYDVHALRCYN